jgi:D-alanyl-D-alanine-carboxypeptidase/D-alanyl-D-alanine-endopeptidase
VVVTRSPLTRFTAMSDGVNNLLAELVGNQNGSPMRIDAIN